jgi:hypothetical protein
MAAVVLRQWHGHGCDNISLLSGGCDVCRGLTSTVSLAGCGAACRRRPLWQRVLGRTVKDAPASEVACRWAGRASRRR